MAYGVNATVTFMMGGLTTLTSGNIDTIIVDADVIVDNWNSSASTDSKRVASNIIATSMAVYAEEQSQNEIPPGKDGWVMPKGVKQQIRTLLASFNLLEDISPEPRLTSTTEHWRE